MKKPALLLGILVLAIGVTVGWQIGASELANYQLRDDLQDIASESGARIGLKSPASDSDLRREIVADARLDGIHLQPGQITVHRSSNGEAPVIFLQVDYSRPVWIAGWAFHLNFSVSSAK